MFSAFGVSRFSSGFTSGLMYSLILILMIRNGSDTRGYFVWSMIDVYELLSGYMYSYGMYDVNFSDPGLKRSPKLSASWYTGFLNGTVDAGPRAITRLQSNISGSSSF